MISPHLFYKRLVTPLGQIRSVFYYPIDVLIFGPCFFVTSCNSVRMNDYTHSLAGNLLLIKPIATMIKAIYPPADMVMILRISEVISDKVSDKNSCFDRGSIGEMGLCVKKIGHNIWGSWVMRLRGGL